LNKHSGFHRPSAVALASALVGRSVVLSRLPRPWRVPLQAVVAGLLVAVTRAPLGLRPPWLWSGMWWGSVAGSVAVAGVAATTAVPVARMSMVARQLPLSAPAWLMWQIPFGTVWAEEAAFRAPLARVAAEAFGASTGQLLQAASFGLSHIPDARAAGEPVPATVLATGVAGWLLGWLENRSGSLAAPMLAHLAINETAAVAALSLQRHRTATRP
jgi:CAAX protease family protein